jgi:hypothetical protein
MAFSQLSQAKSLGIPAHWQQPLYQFNERVKFFCPALGWKTGVIRGIDFIESEDEYGSRTPIDTGWYYEVLIDKNHPYHFVEPRQSVHEENLIKATEASTLVTVVSR